jgi:DNA-binding CsgD family transcriptional regulator
VGDTGAGASGPVWLERGDLDGQPIYLVLLGPDRTGGGLQERLRQFDLSRRESEVALLVAGGSSTPEISTALCRSINTIETHLKSIFRKMGVNSRAGMAHRLYAP